MNSQGHRFNPKYVHGHISFEARTQRKHKVCPGPHAKHTQNINYLEDRKHRLMRQMTPQAVAEGGALSALLVVRHW